MKNTLIKYLAVACTVAVLFSACRKDSYEGTQTGDSGTTFIRITEATVKKQFFTPFTDIKAVKMFSVRRDAANNADLKKDIKVTLTALPQSYLDEHYPGFTVIDPSVFTFATNASITSSSNGLVFDFAPGDFAKNLIINVNGALLDPSVKFAMAYAITDAQGVKNHAGLDTIVSTIGIKNAYDGRYDIAGAITRYNSGTSDPDNTLGGTYPTPALTSAVATIGATENTFQLFWITGGGISGIDGLRLAVDPATNLVTVTAPLSPGSKLANTPGEVNSYDPATKTFKLHFTWGATNKRIANITLTYSKSL